MQTTHTTPSRNPPSEAGPEGKKKKPQGKDQKKDPKKYTRYEIKDYTEIPCFCFFLFEG